MRPSSLALAGTILAGLLLLAATAAVAHDHWIARGEYRSPVDNALCCGPNDCLPLADDDVAPTPA